MADQAIWALGLMSGTSLDGVDAALLRTDGNRIYEIGASLTIPFDDELRTRLHEAVYMRGDLAATERDLTLAHVQAVKALLTKAAMRARDVAVIGFHGQTVAHRPHQGITWQMGDGALLAEKTGIDVVSDFRRRDVAAGGQGAPLVPLYHAALVRDMPLPVAILNIGGIANVTWVGSSENTSHDIMALDILALDTGPGNVLLNEWVLKHTGAALDKDGAIAKQGKVDENALVQYFKDAFFSAFPPKSLDRNYFTLEYIEKLSVEDGAATLTAFTAAAIAAAQDYFPAPAKAWYVSGGGRHNPTMMEEIAKRLPQVASADVLGWVGDAIEAQAFGYLAVRSLRHLPLTLPTTTGCNRPVTGGALYKA